MTALFFVMALLSVVSAIGLVAFKNPIHSALCLVVNLVMVAGCYAMLNAHFLAAVQIIVYAGAIMVLVLFMLMLLNVKVEKRTSRENVFTLVSIGVGVAFLLLVLPLVHEAFTQLPEINRVGRLQALSEPQLEGTVKEIGTLLFSRYTLLFQASGLLLMVAIVGAVTLAKRHYQRSQ